MSPDSDLATVDELRQRLSRLWEDLRSQGGSVVEAARQIEVLFERVIAERNQALGRLRASEERYRQLVETAEEGIWLIDAEARTSFVNSKMADILGYGVDDSVGRPLFSFMDVDARKDAQDLVKRRKEGIRERHEFSFRRKDGTAVTTSVAASPLFDKSGRYAGAMALVNDITDQKWSREHLEASEERLALALSVSRQGLWDWSLVTDDSYLSPTYWELTGYTEGEVRADLAFFLSLVHPDDRPTVEKTLQDHLAGKSPLHVIEYRMKRKTGEYVWTRAVGRVTARDDRGAPLRMVGVILDITARKRFDEEQRFLAEAGALLSSSLDYEPTLTAIATMAVGAFADWCGVDLVDEHQGLMRLKVVSADPTQSALCARLEQLPSERNQHHLARAVIEMRRPLLLARVTRRDLESYAQGPEHLQALLAMGATSAMAVPLLRQDHALGVLVFISSTPSRVYGPSDSRFAETLAERAALAIENARLYRASVEAARLRDQVLSVVAHDLRNPLATILLQSTALGRHGPTAERRSQRPWEIIHRAATRMNRLIQDLMEVGLLEIGQLRLQRGRLPAAELVVEAMETQRPLATSASLQLRIDVERDIPEVWGDRDCILEVFENLIGNAVKFTRPGGDITVGATTNLREVVFWVADSGSGIAPDVLPHVFDRFWQATRADRRGAGLGLPIAKGIVEAHGGRIWVESAPGHGSTFAFSIPKAHPETDRPSAIMH